MKKLVCLVLLLLLTAAVCPAAVERAVSLSVLQSSLKSGAVTGQDLCGLTTISGFVADQGGHDVILLGKVELGSPQIQMDDLVVAMRSAWSGYNPRRPADFIAPGCSIDADPAVYSQMIAASDSMISAADADARTKAFDLWNELGKQPQTVRVSGVPVDTHFAKVMVDADYFMKRLVDGSAKVTGLKSLVDMCVESRLTLPKEGAQAVPSSNSVNRFWFCPGQISYGGDEICARLTSCPVRLMTEHQYLNDQGKIVPSARQNPLAQQFATNLTANYQQIAAQKPVYRELENLYRLTALASIMKDTRATERCALPVDYVLRSYTIHPVPVPRTLAGIAAVKEATAVVDTPEGGKAKIYTYQVSCGGVSMHVRPRIARSGSAIDTAAARTLRKTVLAARKSPKDLYWDYEAGS